MRPGLAAGGQRSGRPAGAAPSERAAGPAGSALAWGEPGEGLSLPAGRVLVTGGTGFIGSHLVDALCGLMVPGSVRVLVRATSDTLRLRELGVELVPGHLGDPAALRDAVSDAETVLHLAALTRAPSAKAFRETNAEGTRRLFEAASREGRVGRFVYLSSMAAAGPAWDGRPVAPGDPPHPLTAYGRSKLAGERACLGPQAAPDPSRTGTRAPLGPRSGLGASEEEGAAVDGEAAGPGGRRPEVVILRPPAVYGPRDRDLLPFFRLARRGLLPLPGRGERRLQLVYVRDLVRALLRAASPGSAPGVYHVADPTAYRWEEVLERVAGAVGRKGRLVRVPPSMVKAAGAVVGAAGRLRRRPAIFDGDKAKELLAPAWLCDTAQTREALRLSAFTPLEEGLAETAAWYRSKGWL